MWYLQHLVGARLNAWWHVAGVEGQLLHLCKVVDWVPVEYQLSHRNQRVFFVGPNLNEKAQLAGKKDRSRTDCWLGKCWIWTQAFLNNLYILCDSI